MRAQGSYFPVFQSPENMPDLQGRTAIVTGGACGIGSEIARALVIHKCKVIMVNVHEKQSTETISAIRAEVGEAANASLEHRYCDMTDLIQVQEVFSTLCDELPRLDLCIFGSGIDQEHFTTDLHCIDAYFGMMWLGHFYASNLLWPLLRRTSRIADAPAPRVIFEAPGQQRRQSLCDGSSSSDEEDLRLTAEVNSEIFRRSKTSLLLGVRHGLAERIVKRHHDNIYVLAVQPSKNAADGAAQPRRDSHWQPSDLCDCVLDTLSKDSTFAARSSSRITLYAATSTDVEQKYLNGAYLVDVGVSKPEKHAAADPCLGPGFYDISERAIKAVVGKDAMVPWDHEWVASPKPVHSS